MSFHPPSLQISLTAIREGAADILVQLLTSPLAEIRAAAIFGLGCLIHSCPEQHPQLHHHGVGGAPGGQAADMPPGISVGQPSEERLPAELLIANAVTQVGGFVGWLVVWLGGFANPSALRRHPDVPTGQRGWGGGRVLATHRPMHPTTIPVPTTCLRPVAAAPHTRAPYTPLPPLPLSPLHILL